MGVELFGKTLGLIGCGNIGSIVADRAQGLHMKVIAYDPYLTDKRALDLGVEKVELDELLGRADFITLHTPLTDATRNILDRRGAGEDQDRACGSSTARAAAWSTRRRSRRRSTTGHVAGAALDVFETEPATDSPLFGTAERGLHAASRRRDRRGAGERGAAGRRADERLPAHRRGRQRDQHGQSCRPRTRRA